MLYHNVQIQSDKQVCVNLIDLCSIIRRYHGICIGYFLDHWWLTKVKPMYISSMAVDICDYLDKIQNTHTFQPTIFFFSNFITLRSVQKAFYTGYIMSDVEVWQRKRTYDVKLASAKRVDQRFAKLFNLTQWERW